MQTSAVSVPLSNISLFKQVVDFHARKTSPIPTPVDGSTVDEIMTQNLLMTLVF